jgi:hypothetical protein
MMAVLGIAWAGIFFINFWTTPESARLTLLSSGIIPPCNIGIALKVASSLYLVTLVLTAHRLNPQVRTRGEDES